MKPAPAAVTQRALSANPAVLEFERLAGDDAEERQRLKEQAVDIARKKKALFEQADQPVTIDASEVSRPPRFVNWPDVAERQPQTLKRAFLPPKVLSQRRAAFIESPPEPTPATAVGTVPRRELEAGEVRPEPGGDMFYIVSRSLSPPLSL